MYLLLYKKETGKMKKLVGIGLAAAISFGALSGCSLLGEKANA